MDIKCNGGHVCFHTHVVLVHAKQVWPIPYLGYFVGPMAKEAEGTILNNFPALA